MHRLRFVLILILLGAGTWILSNRITHLAEVPDLSTRVEQFQKRISAPDPLRSNEDSPLAFLTRAGIVEWTNRSRAEENLPALEPDPELNAAALAKVRDMFARQYFAHISPSGTGAADLASQEGYDYISIGENLALGNFENDEDLVAAWLDSPGHRANILADSFTQIGAAAEQGMFEGRRVWLAVQIFALPRSACPYVDESLKVSIDRNEVRLDQMRKELQAQRQELEQYTPKRGDEYNAKVEAYNSQVQKYNNLLLQTKQLIDEYNSQVNAFNFCLNS